MKGRVGAAGGKRSFLKVIAALLAVVVTVLFVSAGMRIGHYAQGREIDYDVRDYLYSAEHGRYGELYETTLRDMSVNAGHSAEVEDCRVLGYYYEQAVLEHAYRVAGDDEKADAFAARMDDYAAQLGSMSGRAADVREVVVESA